MTSETRNKARAPSSDVERMAGAPKHPTSETKALSKRKMFGDQTLVWLPNMLMLNRVAKRCETCLTKERSNPRNKPYLWIQVKERALNACVGKTCFTKPSKRTKCCTVLIKCLTPFKFYQTQPKRSNTIQQHQTRCPNGKMFGHQTMFEHG